MKVLNYENPFEQLHMITMTLLTNGNILILLQTYFNCPWINSKNVHVRLTFRSYHNRQVARVY